MKILLQISFLFLSLVFITNKSAAQEVYETSNCEFSGFNESDNGLRFLWIPGLPGPGNIRYNSTENSLSFKEFSDGTVHIYGHVHNQTHSNYGWELDIWFKEKANWTEWSQLGRDWKGGSEEVGTLYETWDYYVMDESKSNTLTGTGPYEGSVLNLIHNPIDLSFGLQVGEAANDHTEEPGLSCWMFYNGVIDGEEYFNNCDINGAGVCTDILDLECALDSEIDCTESSLPEQTGYPSYDCEACVLTYVDEVEGTCPIVISRTWTLTSPTSETVECEQTITVSDTEAPVFINPPEDMTIECGGIPPAEIEVQDNCSDSDPSIEIMEYELSGTCFPTIYRVFVAEDACGNVATHSQYIVVVDTEAPVLVNEPEDLILTCGEEVPEYTPEATDSCDNELIIEQFSDEIPSACGFRLEQVWVITDHCGNSISTNRVILFEDSSAPVAVSDTTPLSLECGEELPDVIFEDDCGEVEVEVVLGQAGNCSYTQTVYYTATDNCGNQVIVEREITRIDSSAPEFLAEQLIDLTCGSPIPEPEVLDCNNVDLTFVDSNSNTGCGEVIRTWTATDDCGNTSDFNQTIVFSNNEPPVFAGDFSDLDMSCLAFQAYDLPSATDYCGNDLEVTFDDVFSQNDCGYTITRTWIAEDGCGNIATQNQLINVTDQSAPVISGDLKIAAQCGQEITELVTVEDDCSEFIQVNFTEEFISNSECEHAVERVYTATDVCGNSSSFTQVINFSDTEGPEIIGAESTFISCASELESVNLAQATDNCGEVTLTFLDETSGSGCTQSVLRTYTAVDNCGNQTTVIQLIEITDEEPPVFESTPETLNVSCSESLPAALLLTALDNCSNVSVSMTEDEIAGDCGLPSVLRTWTATDECGNSSEVTQLINFIDTEPPVFITELDDITLECGAEISIPEVEAEDNCSELTIEFSEDSSTNGCPNILRTWTATDQCGNSTILLQNIIIEDNEAPVLTGIVPLLEASCSNIPAVPVPGVADNCDSEVNVILTEAFSGSGCETILIRQWIASDNCGNTTIVSQSIVLTDTEPPVFINPVAINAVECADLENLALPQVDDDCAGEVALTYTDEELSVGCESEITRTYLATDLCGNTASFVQTIFLIDLSPPTFTNVPLSTFVDCGAIPEVVNPDVSDSCSSSELEVEFIETSFGEGSCSYTVQRTWVATDDCGNTNSTTQFIFVSDTQAPVFDEVPENLILGCDASIPGVGDVVLSDNCDENLDIQFEEETVELMCGELLKRTWTATDLCGNQSSHTQTIEFTDLDSPVILEVPTDIEVSCSDIPAAVILSATDVCDPSPLVIYSEEVIIGNCPYEIIRTWRAIDNCGNESESHQVITVVDLDAPVLSSLPADIQVPCNEVPDAPVLTATDNCSSDVSVEYAEELEGELCNRTLLRTWTATDFCGNKAIHVQTLVLTDTSAPLVGEYQEEITVECTERFSFDELEFTDDCFGLEVTFMDQTIDSECESEYDLVRTWVATDVCGNYVQAIQTIHVVDTSSPLLNLEDSEITVACEEVSEIPTVVSFGECGTVETDFSENTEYLEDARASCSLGNAESFTGDVAIWLPSLSGSGNDFVFGQEAGSFVRDAATRRVYITGQVYNTNNPNESWILDIILEDEMNWTEWSANGGSYKDDLNLNGDNYLDWSYLKLSSESKLIGAEDYLGSELNLTHTPVDHEFGFQLGVGANNSTPSNGIAGWFFYEGNLNGDYVFGTGDLIADLKCCPDQDITRIWTVTDCAGNSTTVTQIIHVRQDLTLSNFETVEVSDPVFDVVNSVGSEYIIVFDSGEDAVKTLVVTDISGKVVYQETYAGLEKNTEYLRTVSKSGQKEGMYMFFLHGNTSVSSDREMNMK